MAACSFQLQAQSWKWGQCATGSGTDGWPVATDLAGNVFYAAVNFGGQPVVFGSYTLPCAPNMDYQCVIAKYDPNGNFLWAIGTMNGATCLVNIATDLSGNVFMLGAITDTGFSMGDIAVTNHNYPNPQYFLAKIGPAGNVLWVRNGGSNQGSFYSVYLMHGLARICGTGGVTADAAGNSYITSNFTSPTVTVGSYTLTNSDRSGNTDDILVAKYDPDGNLVWATSMGGKSEDDAYGIAVTPAGDVYIAGVFASPSLTFGTNSITNTTDSLVAFIGRFNSSGSPVWAATSGGNGGEYAAGLAADAQNNVYMTGGFNEKSIAFSGTTISNPYPGTPVLYLVKFNPANQVSWFNTIGSSSGSAWGYSVATSLCGEIWVSGAMSNEVYVGGHLLSASGDQPVFIAGYDISGSVAGYAALLSGGDDQTGLACDSKGNIYLCSDYESDPISIGPDGFPPIPVSDEFMYVGKYASVSNIIPDTTYVKNDTFICTGGVVTLHAPAGYPGYLWLNGTIDSSLLVNTSGSFWVAAIAQCGTQVVIDSFTVNTKNFNVTFSLGNDTSVCNSMVLHVPVSGVTVYWQNQDTGKNYTVSQSGEYYATILEDGCAFRDSVQITVTDIEQHLKDTTLCRESFSEYTLTANVPQGGTVLWSTGSVQPTITVNETGMYWVTVKDNGCTGTDTMTLSTGTCNCVAFLPEAFTPNNDGKNDEYQPIFESGCAITGYLFSIYNRWGQQVFSSNDPSAKWDGHFNGALAELGVYMYYLEYKTGSIGHFAKGDLTLIR